MFLNAPYFAFVDAYSQEEGLLGGPKCIENGRGTEQIYDYLFTLMKLFFTA